MNTYWMMTGDWGTMPMNRRGPAKPKGKHYDLIVWDDVASADDADESGLSGWADRNLASVDLPLCWNCAENVSEAELGGEVCGVCWRGGVSPKPEISHTEWLARQMLADFARTPARALRGFDRALAKVRGRTATEAAMEASESLRRLEGVEAAKQEMAYQMKKMQRIAAEQEASFLMGRCPHGCIGSRMLRATGDEVDYDCGHRHNWTTSPEKPPG
jgi:hypothetical protein